MTLHRNINVWYYNEILSNWVLKFTNDIQESTDEYNYFRVISESKKHFYLSAEDYLKHNNHSYDIDKSITNVKGELIN